MSVTLDCGLYAITDCTNLAFDTLLIKTRQIFEAGVIALQYRDESNDQQLRMQRAKGLQKLCRQFNVPFLINDDIQLADTVGADGVHIGKDDASYQQARQLLGDSAIIGISCYNDLGTAISAQQSGANYIAFGSFYSTSTKKNTVTSHPDLLIEAKQVIMLPIVAIGGITPENGNVLLQAGADILAVVSSIYLSDEPQLTVYKFNTLFQQDIQITP